MISAIQTCTSMMKLNPRMQENAPFCPYNPKFSWGRTPKPPVKPGYSHARHFVPRAGGPPCYHKILVRTLDRDNSGPTISGYSKQLILLNVVILRGSHCIDIIEWFIGKVVF